MALDPDEVERIKGLRDPNVTKKSQWGQQPTPQKKPNPNDSIHTEVKPLFGKEQGFKGGQAKKAARDWMR